MNLRPLRPEREMSEQRQREEDHCRRMQAQQREQIRFDMRLFYDRYRAELQSVFSTEVFESYLSTFLTEGTPVELFEQRAEQLKEMIRDRLQLNSRRETPRFATLDELLKYFADRKASVRQLQADDPDVVDTLISTLDEVQDKAIREFMT